MNKHEFLEALRRELSFLPTDDLEDAINYYDEYITDSEDEEKALSELGSPKRVADDFKKEYYNKNDSDNSLPIKWETKSAEQSSSRPIWLYVLIVVLAIGFGVPLLKIIGDLISSAASVIILIILALILIKVLSSKSKSYERSSAYVQTCSDITKLDINLGAGKFVIEQGDGFAISGGECSSSISNGVWYISGNAIDNVHRDSNMIITITVPHNFTATSAKIKLGAGNLLVKALSAYSAELEVSVGNMEAVGIYSQNLKVKCGVGRAKIDASMHGDVAITCGMGDAYINFTNRKDDFNLSTNVGLGKVIVDGREMRGKTADDIGAPHNMSIKCGMGNVKVGFVSGGSNE